MRRDRAPPSRQDLTIVIPTLNEESAIGQVIDELLKLGYRKDNILVVDGDSEDRTVEIARERGVRVIRQEGKGKADAIRTATKFIETPYTLVMDGDHTYDPKYVEEMLGHADRYEEVIGARTYGRGNIPAVHRFGNWALTKLFNLLFGTRLRDVCSGMYLIKTSVAKEMAGRSKGFGIEAEMAAAASLSGEVMDIPISYRRRIGRKKLSSLKDGLRIGIDMLRLSWSYNPLFFIFGIASLALVPGLLLALWVGYELIFLGVKHYVWGIISVTLSIGGILSLLIAILALYLKRMERRLAIKYEEIKRLLEGKG